MFQIRDGTTDVEWKGELKSHDRCVFCLTNFSLCQNLLDLITIQENKLRKLCLSLFIIGAFCS